MKSKLGGVDPSKLKVTWEYLHELFASNSEGHPQALALDIPPSLNRPYRYSFTYEDLELLSRGYTSRLKLLGSGEQIVALYIPRTSEHLWAAQIGVMRAGFAYVCIDPMLPDEVIRRTISDANPIAIIADPQLKVRLESQGSGPFRIISTNEVHPGDSTTDGPKFEPDQLAYLIYTSGTSGLPKGVMIEHRSISNLVRSDIAEFTLGPGDRVAQGSSAGYDSSVEEAWLAFGAGATLVVMDDDAARLGPDLVDWLKKERITVLCPPPTLLRTMSCANPSEALPDLKLLYVGGEALTPDVADVWAPGRRLVNGYGPTECTVTCIRTDILAGQPITIGRPVDGISAFVLDEEGKEVPAGETGELCLGGVGLARGYRNSPEVTALKFIEDAKLGRIYRTGDLVRFETDGNLTYFGRIDAQIKLRGYRIELEAIEAVIAQFRGVRETACRLQRDGTREWLSAHIVPEGSQAQIDFNELRDFIGAQLPSYMTPTAYRLCESLPKSVGGKLRRDALEFVAPHYEHSAAEIIPAGTEAEKFVVKACQEIFGGTESISINDDFFYDLGGSSLLASKLVTLLRANPKTSSITVRDIYEGRTIEGIANRIGCSSPPTQSSDQASVPHGKPGLATAIQSLVILGELAAGSVLAAWFVLIGVPWFDHIEGITMLLLGWPLMAAFGFALFTPVAIVIAALVKRILIGSYKPASGPVWGSLYVRNWVVRQAIRIIPWRHIEGTEFACIALRALGAKIGKGVHFHHGALPLTGGWDLLEIGDNASICQEAVLNLVNLERGQVVFGRIKIGAGAVVETRAMVGPNSEIGKGATLTPLSSLAPGSRIEDGELWNGIPAKRTGRSPAIAKSDERQMTPVAYSTYLTIAKAVLGFVQLLPFQISFLAAYQLLPANNAVLATSLLGSVGVCLLISILCVPMVVLLEAVLCRVIGRVRPGTIPLRSSSFVRVWMKSLIVEASGRWLSGTLFWPIWLRLAGMKIGKDCEISTIIDVVPELVSIGDHVFFADGIYLGSPEIREGFVTLAPLEVSSNSFLGNHSVVPGGQSLPPDILLGVCTVADDKIMRPGTSWFGLPPMELPRREIVDVDESLTFKPSLMRYWNRVFWESLRFTVPAVPLFSFYLWWDWLEAISGEMHSAVPFVFRATAVGLAMAALLCLTVLGLKWALLGRVKEGIHPLWSCWCSRWDFLYVAWGEWARPLLMHLEGTLLLIPYLRAMGMTIGKRVVLATGFAHVVDPDMIIIEDDATVAANYQAHTFEDRVLKIGKVVVKKGATLGRATVPLYGAVVGEYTRVEANSVIMKHEHLLPGHRYQGAPTNLIQEALK